MRFFNFRTISAFVFGVVATTGAHIWFQGLELSDACGWFGIGFAMAALAYFFWFPLLVAGAIGFSLGLWRGRGRLTTP